MNDIRKKAKEYAKFKHKEEYDNPIYHRDVVETINDFEAGYRKALSISRVVCCARCGETLSDEMLEEQKDEIEMDCDALCKKHWEDDRLYMADLVMY